MTFGDQGYHPMTITKYTGQMYIKNVYFGASDIKYGAFGGALNLLNYSNFKTKVFGGIMEEECEELLKEYFRSIRK